jgi:hypothetical protein
MTPRSTGRVQCASSLLTYLVVVMAWTFLPPEELTHRRPTGERQEGPVRHLVSGGNSLLAGTPGVEVIVSP